MKEKMASSVEQLNIDHQIKQDQINKMNQEHVSCQMFSTSSSPSLSASPDDLLQLSFEDLIEQLRQDHLQPEEFFQLNENSARVRHCLHNDLIRHRFYRYLCSCDRTRSSFKCNSQSNRLRSEAIRLQNNRNQNQLALRVLYKALQFVSFPVCLRNDFNPDAKQNDIQQEEQTKENKSTEEENFARLLLTICNSLFALGRYSQCLATLDLVLQLSSEISGLIRLDCLLEKAACVRMQGDTAKSNQLLAECIALIDSQPLSSDPDQHLQRKQELLLEYKRKVGRPRNVSETEVQQTPLELYDFEQQQLSSRLRKVNKDTKWHPQLREMKSQGKGRGLFVTGNVAHDQILLQETPVASLARSEFSDSICCHCLRDLQGPKQLQLPVPCPFCTDVLFCSLDCQTTAWQKFHWYECGNEHWLNECGSVRLALRVVTSNQNWHESIFAHKKQESSSFSQIMSHSESFEPDIRARQTLASVLFAQFLLSKMQKRQSLSSSCSSSFTFNVLDSAHNQNQPDLINDCSRISNQEQLLSERILLHLQQVAVNSICIYRPLLKPLNLRCPVTLPPFAPLTANECERLLMFGQRAEQIGLGFYASTSTINHSCVPSGDLFFFDGYRLQARSRRELRAGEELTISYGPLFSRQSRRVRRNSLLKSHYFQCQCEACQWTETSTSTNTATSVTIAAITDGLESVHLMGNKRNSLSRISIRKKSRRKLDSQVLLPSKLTCLDPLRYQLADAFLCPLCDHPLLVDFEGNNARCLNPMQSHQSFNLNRLAQEFSDAQHCWLQAVKGQLNDRPVYQKLLQPLQCLLWPQNRMLLGAQLEAAKHSLASGNELDALSYLNAVRVANRNLFGEKSAEYLHSLLDQILIRCKLALDQQLASGQQLSKAMKQANAQWKKIADGSIRPQQPANNISFQFKLPIELRQQLEVILIQFWMLLLNQYVLMAQTLDRKSGSMKKSSKHPTGYLLLDDGAVNNCLLAYRQILRYWPG